MPSSTVPSPDVTTDECTLSDGRTLTYTTAGDPNGTPVVVHHGTPGSRLFAALLADAARDTGVRLVVPDRPGYGYSTPPPEGWEWDDWRADFEELLAVESIEHVAVLGFSGGGPFAIAAATSDRANRVGLLSALIPPVEGGLASLARVPLALRVLFRLSDGLARVIGPGVIVEQYTNRDVADAVAEAVAAEFHEALRQGARAPARESRLAATTALDATRLDIPIRAWHGTGDENAPLDPLETFVVNVDGEVTVRDRDHLGTVLDCRRDALEWLAGNGP